MDKQIIKIFGERSTGTNYLIKLLDLNFEVAIKKGVVPDRVKHIIKKLPNTELFKDLYFELNKRSTLGWKHSEFKNNNTFKKNVNRYESIVFIASVKNPYSWLLSLYKKPYHNKVVKELDFEDFLQTPWKTVRRGNTRSNFKNPVEIWNQKNRSYYNLTQCYPNSYLMKYEEVLKNPIKELETLIKKFNIQQKRDPLENYTKSTKEAVKNNKFYKDYYGNEKWKKIITSSQIASINENLDKELMDILGYEML